MLPRRDQLAVLALGALLALAPAVCAAQSLVVVEGNLKQRANGVLALMGYMVTPDVTTGSLGISNAATGNPDLAMTTLGGGFTLRGRYPLYLEGTLGYARYDPTFVTTNGQVERQVESQWDAYSATGGVGWDFPLAARLVVRPVLNFSLGRVDSAISVREESGDEIGFLANGKLDSRGFGGSLILDYEDYRPEREIDVELRYTNIRLSSLGGSASIVQGSADAESVSFWTRRRAPSGITLLERPLRYVLEFAYSRFFGDLDGVLGFNDVASFGAGVELDSSARDIPVERTRLMLRYRVGENVTGWSIGLAVSF